MGRLRWNPWIEPAMESDRDPGGFRPEPEPESAGIRVDSDPESVWIPTGIRRNPCGFERNPQESVEGWWSILIGEKRYLVNLLASRLHEMGGRVRKHPYLQ